MAWTPEKEKRYKELKGIAHQEGWLEKVAGSAPVQSVLGAGDALVNMQKAAYSTVTGSEYNPEKSGQGTAYDIGKMAGNIAPYVVPGPHQASIPARLATAGATGYLFNPEDPAQGAKEGLTFGAALEAIPYVGKGASFLGDKLSRSHYTKELAKNIKQSFEKEKEQAWGIVKPVFDEIGDARLSKSLLRELNSLMSQNTQYMTKGIKDLKKTFLEKPTLNNLQKLQSQVAADTRGLDLRQAKNQEAVIVRDSWRKGMTDAIEGVMDTLIPGSSKKYGEFRKEYATGPAQYQANPTLKKVTEGKVARVSPKRLNMSLQEGIESGIPEEHYLSQIAPELQQKLGRSDLYQALLGGAIGGLAGGGWGAAAGASIPKALGHLAPNSSVLFHDELSRLLSKGYPSIRQMAIGAKNAPKKEER